MALLYTRSLIPELGPESCTAKLKLGPRWGLRAGPAVMTVPLPLPGGLACPVGVLVNDSVCVESGLGDQLRVAVGLVVFDGVAVAVLEEVGVRVELADWVGLLVLVGEALEVTDAVRVGEKVTLAVPV